MNIEEFRNMTIEQIIEMLDDKRYWLLRRTYRVLTNSQFTHEEAIFLLSSQLALVYGRAHTFKNDEEAIVYFEELLWDILILKKEDGNRLEYEFFVALKGYETKINRQIIVPGRATLADFAYAILATLNASGKQLFNFEFEEVSYYSDLEKDFYANNPYAFASEIGITDLMLNVNDEIKFFYDYKENYEFSITLNDIKHLDKGSNKIIPRVIDGKGEGILESNKDLLEAYFNNKKVEVPFDISTFDLEKTNSYFKKNFTRLKKIYHRDEKEEYYSSQQLLA